MATRKRTGVGASRPTTGGLMPAGKGSPGAKPYRPVKRNTNFQTTQGRRRTNQFGARSSTASSIKRKPGRSIAAAKKMPVRGTRVRGTRTVVTPTKRVTRTRRK